MTTVADVRLSERHRDRINVVIDRAVERTGRAWDGLGDWTGPGVEARWLALWSPIDEAAVTAAVAATDSYFAVATQQAPLGAEAVSGAALRGVDAGEYLRRPLVQVWTALKRGVDWADAVRQGRDRATTLAATDVQLGQRRVAQQWAESGRVVGYRRTLTGRSCVLCALASTQRYTRGDLAPIHDRCDCGVAPIRGDVDPGRVVNRDLLRRVKEADREGGRFEVHQHGELGPVLTREGDRFTGPEDLN